MNARGAGRLWLIGGILAIVVLVAATYLLAIKPVYDEKAAKELQIDDQQTELIKVKRDLNDLQTKSKNMAGYVAKLKASRTQLPDNYDIPNYLRQLQKTDTAIKIDNNSINVSAPVTVPGSATVVGVPITLLATGEPGELSKFVSRVQNTQNRAVLISTATLTVLDPVDTSTMSLSLTAFCSKNDENDCTATA